VDRFITVATLAIILSSLAFGYEAGKQDNTGRIVGTWNDKPVENSISFVMKRIRTK